jgi:hypothetical protein
LQKKHGAAAVMIPTSIDETRLMLVTTRQQLGRSSHNNVSAARVEHYMNRVEMLQDVLSNLFYEKFDLQVMSTLHKRREELLNDKSLLMDAVAEMQMPDRMIFDLTDDSINQDGDYACESSHTNAMCVLETKGNMYVGRELQCIERSIAKEYVMENNTDYMCPVGHMLMQDPVTIFLVDPFTAPALRPQNYERKRCVEHFIS